MHKQHSGQNPARRAGTDGWHPDKEYAWTRAVAIDRRRYDPDGLSRILGAVLDVFAEQGYHGASIRGVAARSGLSVPGLYHHYRSKQDILDLLTVTIGELAERADAAVASAGQKPGAEFDVVVEMLLRFHMIGGGRRWSARRRSSA